MVSRIWFIPNCECQIFPVRVLFFVATYPAEWVARYRREEFSRIDPVYSASRTNFLPIDWRALDQQSPDARYVFSGGGAVWDW